MLERGENFRCVLVKEHGGAEKEYKIHVQIAEERNHLGDIDISVMAKLN